MGSNENKSGFHRIYFDYGKVYGNLKRYIDRFNEGKENLTDRLNANHRATSELIIRLYLKQLNEASKVAAITANEIPPFRTYNESLASCKGCTSRTIINHRERLVKANVILAEQRKGAEGLDMWINPEILGDSAQKTEILSFEKLKIEPNRASSSNDVKNFQGLVHVLQEQININSSVDNKGVLTDKCGLPKGEAAARTIDKNTKENAKSSGESGKRAKQEQIPVDPERIFVLSMIEEFVLYALITLYGDLKLCAPEKREIKNLVWASLFKRLNVNLTKNEWLKYQDELFERVRMVRGWLDRSPTNWIPPPHIYFHENNKKNGFDKTLIWLENQEIAKIKTKRRIRFQKMKKELRDYHSGKGRYLNKSLWQLVLIHKKQLSLMGDEALKEAYLSQLRSQVKTIKHHYANT